MRWSLVLCLLLASAVLARPRSKRSLGYIKSVILTKLFGPRDTTVFIAHPASTKPIAKNETYKLYKIPGFDDILIKVSKKLPNKSENNEVDKEKHEEKDKNKHQINKPEKPLHNDPVIVKPEVAIIGSYLGTSTEKETLIALEVVKRLLKSGILNGGRDNWIQEVAMPMISEPHLEYIEQNIPKEYLHVYAEKQGHVFAPSMSGMKQVNIINRNAIPVYPVEYSPPFEAPEIKLGPVQSKYSYKQKGNTADMTYESYNNKDVIVTRTEKEPRLPHFIKMRLADVATIGANPFLVQQPFRMGVPVPMPVPYIFFRPGIGSSNPIRINEALQESEYTGSINTNTKTSLKTSYVPNMQDFILCAEQITKKRCPYANINAKANKDPSKENELMLSKDIVHNKINKTVNDNKDKNNQAFNEFLKNQSVYGQFVSQYSYNQMNHQSHDNYTIVDLGEGLQLSEDSKVDVSKDFVYIPPTVDVPTPIALGFKGNNEPMNNAEKEKANSKNVFTSKVETNELKYITKHNTTLKTNDDVNADDDLKQNPIIVTDEPENVYKLSDAKTNRLEGNKVSDVNNKRGDIPGSTF